MRLSLLRLQFPFKGKCEYPPCLKQGLYPLLKRPLHVLKCSQDKRAWWAVLWNRDLFTEWLCEIIFTYTHLYLSAGDLAPWKFRGKYAQSILQNIVSDLEEISKFLLSQEIWRMDKGKSKNSFKACQTELGTNSWGSWITWCWSLFPYVLFPSGWNCVCGSTQRPLGATGKGYQGARWWEKGTVGMSLCDTIKI